MSNSFLEEYMNNIKLMDATRSFFKNFNWTDPVAVTLTFKKGIQIDQRPIMASDDDYRRNVRYFLNFLNKDVYRSLARKAWLINAGSVRETGCFGGIHYHLVLDKPPHLSLEMYTALIHEAWNRTLWGHHIVEVTPDGGDRWINYMTKLRSKENYADAIDWTNTYNATIPLTQIELPFRLKIDRRTDRLFALAAEYAKPNNDPENI
jgi:hypothetical protein